MKQTGAESWFPSETNPTASLRNYSDVLTADVNEKGVLDVDVVKGCTLGMAAKPGTGCYDACYAATIARFRGLDFAHSVTRTVHNRAEALAVERAVKSSPHGFFRIGTMGDPCHAWRETVETVEWLAPFATPVIVTKHWIRATDAQMRRLVDVGTVLNTSVSAIDTPAQLRHREREMLRYGGFGGHSVARVVSCDFDESTADGARMAAVQNRLLAYPHVIDNPLRAARSHPLVMQGIIKLTKVRDLNSERTVSLANHQTYLGNCGDCPDKCGLSSVPSPHQKPATRQRPLFQMKII